MAIKPLDISDLRPDDRKIFVPRQSMEHRQKNLNWNGWAEMPSAQQSA